MARVRWLVGGWARSSLPAACKLHKQQLAVWPSLLVARQGKARHGTAFFGGSERRVTTNLGRLGSISSFISMFFMFFMFFSCFFSCRVFDEMVSIQFHLVFFSTGTGSLSLVRHSHRVLSKGIDIFWSIKERPSSSP